MIPFERPWHHALKAHQPFSCLRFGGSRSARLKRAEELSPPRWTSETRQFLAATTSLHSFEHVFCVFFFAFTAICWIAILFQYRFLRLSYGSAISKVSVWGGQMPLACRRSPVDGYQELSGHSACVFLIIRGWGRKLQELTRWWLGDVLWNCTTFKQGVCIHAYFR